MESHCNTACTRPCGLRFELPCETPLQSTTIFRSDAPQQGEWCTRRKGRGPHETGVETTPQGRRVVQAGKEGESIHGLTKNCRKTGK
eukprot:366213-Pleurochrysis_carterae.AAC.2